MKMQEIIKLNNFYPKIKDMKIPIKTAYKFTKLMRQVEKEIEFYQIKFNELISEYGQYDESGHLKITEDGSSIAILPGKENECTEKLSELHNLEVELSDIKFSIEELSSLDISIAELENLMPLIED